MSLPEGAVFADGAEKQISDALEALAKDPHSPRQISVNVILNVHREYPKMLYKGEGTAKSVLVGDEAAEQSARDAGFGEHQPEAAKEE